MCETKFLTVFFSTRAATNRELMSSEADTRHLASSVTIL